MLVAGVTWKTGACARAGDDSNTVDINIAVSESPIDLMVRPMLGLYFHRVNIFCRVAEIYRRDLGAANCREDS